MTFTTTQPSCSGKEPQFFSSTPCKCWRTGAVRFVLIFRRCSVLRRHVTVVGELARPACVAVAQVVLARTLLALVSHCCLAERCMRRTRIGMRRQQNGMCPVVGWKLVRAMWSAHRQCTQKLGQLQCGVLQCGTCIRASVRHKQVDDVLFCHRCRVSPAQHTKSLVSKSYLAHRQAGRPPQALLHRMCCLLQRHLQLSLAPQLAAHWLQWPGVPLRRPPVLALSTSLFVPSRFAEG